MKMFNKNLILDASNLLYRTFFANIKDTDAEDIIVGLCYQAALLTMNKYYYYHKPDNIIMAFDYGSWRKQYTKDLSTCVTNKKYKGNRRKKLSTSQEEKLDIFDQHVDEFFEILSNMTSITVLRKKYLEADDLIAGFVQMYPDDDNIIVSADKDFIQLMRNENVTLVDPFTDKERDLEEWSDDADLFMMEKCFRGDVSDNVQSAYPRLYRTKILQAYKDDVLFNNLMEHEFEVKELDESTNTPIFHNMKTREVFKENKLLMDLTAQPEGIKLMMNQAIEDGLKNKGKFDYYAFMRFCARNDMRRITDNLTNMKHMLKNISPQA